MIKAVLFDFDGTLINTNELIFNSYRKAFKKVLNREISDEEILNLYGRPLRSSLMEYGESGESLYYNYLEYNETNHDKLAKGFDGAREGVIKIKKLGIKVGIVTSKRLLMVQKGINLMNLAGVFDVIVTPEDTAKVKPDPEPVLFGCNALVVEPGETCYVGDSLFDMQAGRLAGTKLCAVKYTLTPYERFSKYSPDYFVDSILEFANILERSCQNEC